MVTSEPALGQLSVKSVSPDMQAEQFLYDDTGEGVLSSPVILQYWQSIVRWRVLIAAVIVFALIAGLVATLLLPAQYEAKTLIEISREQKNITKVEGVEGKVDLNDAEFYETQYKLLKSESLAERVVRSLRLNSSDKFFSAHGIDIESFSVASGQSARRFEDKRVKAATELLLNHVDIRPVPRSRLIEVVYRSESPSLSAEIANSWAAEFIGATMDRQYASSADARQFLEKRLAQLRQRIDQAERDIVRYSSSKGIVTLDTIRDADGKTFTGRTLASTNLEVLNDSLSKAKAERIAAESRLLRGGADASSEALISSVVSNLRSERADLDSQYAKLLAQFDPQYPPALAIKQQRDAIDRAITAELGRITAGRRLAYNEALKREGELRAKVDALVAQLNQQREASIRQTILQRDVDTNSQLYDALLQRYKEIGVAGSIGISNIAIVDQAKIPEAPSSPKLGVNLAISILVGIGLAFLIVFGLEQIDDGIRNPEDARAALNTPLLGNIPLSKDEPLTQLIDAKSDLSEAYFSAYSTLAFSTNQGLPKTFAISSTRPSEGKSTTAYSLAVVVAKTGKKVLLIDGDLRSPSLHEYGGLKNDRGLSNLLAGASIDDHIQFDSSWNLSVLTTGPIPPSPAQLLSGDRFSGLISQFEEQFDHIIVDLPPVLGLADAILMGRCVQGIVYIIKAEKTPLKAIRGSLQRLRAGGVRLFGVIVTQVDYSKHSYGYGYGYGYGYSYGYGDNGKADVK